MLPQGGCGCVVSCVLLLLVEYEVHVWYNFLPFVVLACKSIASSCVSVAAFLFLGE